MLAGFVKGVLGLGLPTVSMGLLAVAMTPGQAAATLVVPSLATNVWQMVAGPHFRALVKRLGRHAGLCLHRHLARRRVAHRTLRALRRDCARPLADRLRGAQPQRGTHCRSARKRDLARPDRRTAHRADHRRHRRVRDPGDHLHAGHRPGEGRAGAGAWPVVHGLDGRALVQPDRRRRPERLARRHRHHGAGRSAGRHVARTGRPPQARSGDVPPLVFHRRFCCSASISAARRLRFARST